MNIKEKDNLTDVVSFVSQTPKPETQTKPSGNVVLSDGREVKLGFGNK